MNKIAVLIPCYNEAKTIGKVVDDFRRELPLSNIYVYDNNSTDETIAIAHDKGAFVSKVPQQGKGYAVRKMFREIDADIYVLVDGDDTYPAEEVQKLIAPVESGIADMVNGDRLSSTYSKENKRPGHNFGNQLVCFLIDKIWCSHVSDVMTGYRVFSRKFVKTCPILSPGFELETEMTLHVLDKRIPFVEVPIMYRDRPEGSYSKLNTLKDGFRVLMTVFNLFRFYRPLLFFSIVSVSFLIVAGSLMIPVLMDYLQSGLVPRFPTLIFSCFLLTAGLLSAGVGIILDAVKKQSDQAFEVEMMKA